MKTVNIRKISLTLLIFQALFLVGITIAGKILFDEALVTDFSRKNLPPSLQYPFGTDWLGRNMLLRTIVGLSMSIQIGLITATVSSIIALALGAASATMGGTVDSIISFIIDMVMGIPHILLLILISFAFGRGFHGIVIGICFTHWTSLARLMRAEVLQIKESTYIKVAEKLGVSKLSIIQNHMLPHLLPQFVTGLILLFPHAILHESSITFLGFGLSPEQPAIGIILSESMKYLVMGNWWLAIFPGALLVFIVILFNTIGENVRKMTSPSTIHE